METSGEVGERAVRLSVVTILVHEFAPHIDGDANEDCAVQARWFQVHSEPIFRRYFTVEAG